MDVVAVLVDLLVALWFLAVIVAIARAWQARLPRPAPLSPDARNQFVNSWHRITAGFIDAPREAVQQADALVLSLLARYGDVIAADRAKLEYQRRKAERAGVLRQSANIAVSVAEEAEAAAEVAKGELRGAPTVRVNDGRRLRPHPGLLGEDLANAHAVNRRAKSV